MDESTAPVAPRPPMIFTTLRFAVSFALFFPAYWLVPASWRRPMLLGASYLFYMSAIPAYATVIIAITAIDYAAGIGIQGARRVTGRRAWLLLSIVSNCAILFTFKYAGFLATSMNAIGVHGLPILRIALPVGLSFHTFQAISYTIEVYRGRCPAERSLVRYALYVAFFPQLVAGPIERPYNLLPQFHRDVVVSADEIASGLRLALWGTFKKLVVADLISVAVNTVYADPHGRPGGVLLVATFFFAIQIYCDFSGYTDIAIGIARMMGYRLMVNFRQPYLARSIPDFWRRWHISLSTWFRDYVFIPLGGSRVAPARIYVNIMIVFILSGLWHGGRATFIAWGMIHGAFYVGGRLSSSLRSRIREMLGFRPEIVAVMQTLVTFALVLVAWVFFRAESLEDAVYVVAHMIDLRAFAGADLLDMGLPSFEIALSFAAIAVVLFVDWCLARQPLLVRRLWDRRVIRLAAYNACLFCIICFGVFGGTSFIYFQF